MKTLLIQQHESKFIQSLLHLQTESEGVKIIGSIFNERLYKLYFLNKPTHVLFIGSKLNAENLQFISEYSNIVKCYIYHDIKLSESLISEHLVSCIHLIEEDAQDSVIPMKFFKIPPLINSQLFNSQNILKKRYAGIVCFIHEFQSELPQSLQGVLLPNSSLPIKMFHNPSVLHPQNLGILTEVNRADVLRQHEYYLAFDNDEYIAEAVACGCKIINPENLPNYLESAKYLPKTQNMEYSTFIMEAMA
jgi:hypothetical protein